jgi:hypothetical protein
MALTDASLHAGSGTSAAVLKRTDAALKRRHGLAVGDVCISAVTLSELMFGVAMSANAMA